MTDDLVFYHNPQSRAAMVHLMLEEVGAPYKTVLVDFEKGEHKTPEFLAINPMGKLPTIVHKGTVVTESGAIIAYLADAFPQAGLAPAIGDPTRGAYLRWLFFGAGCVDAALVDKLMQRPEVERKGALGYGSYEDVLNALKQTLSRTPYLTGDRFTAADLYVGSQLNWAAMFGAPGVKDDPVLGAFLARVADRPVYKRLAPKPA